MASATLPIPMPEQDEDEDTRQRERLYAGIGQLRKTGYAVIEGGIFDLRHPSLSPDAWRAQALVSWFILLPPDSDRPYLPWQKRESLDKRIADEMQCLQRMRNRADADPTLFEPGFEDYIVTTNTQKYERERRVFAGDTVRIASVTTVPMGDCLDPEPDREIRLAHIQIVRTDGTIEPIDQPLEYCRHGSFFTIAGNRKVIFEDVATRICEANGISDLFDLCPCADHLKDKICEEDDNDNSDSTRTAALLETAQRLALSREALSQYVEGQKPGPSDYLQTTPGSYPQILTKKPDFIDVLRMVNDALMLGYMLRRSEEETDVRPLAVAALTTRERRSAGGRTRAARRKTGEIDPIKQAVLVQARQERQEHPNASQEDVATAISRSNLRLGKHSTLVHYIADFERDGLLPRRQAKSACS